MRWFFQASVSDCSNPRLCRLFLSILPIPSIFSNPCHRQHTGSSTHPSSPVSVPSSPTATRGHLPTWASLVSVPTYLLPTDTSSPSRLRFYYMPISPPLLLLLLYSRESSRLARSCISVASWLHHTFLLLPPPSYPVSLVYTPNKCRNATHCTTVACRCAVGGVTPYLFHIF